MTSYGVRVLLNASYEYMKAEYGIPRSTITSHMRKIYHPLQFRNMEHLHKRMITGEMSRLNLRELFQLSVKNHIVGRLTYLSPDEESFLVAAAEIEGARGFPIDTSNISD